MSKTKDNVSATDYDEDYFMSVCLRYEEGIYKTRVENISHFLEDINGLKGLDLGCGNGFFSKLAIENGADITSLDFSTDALKYLRYQYKIDFKPIKGDAEKLPFKEQTFDFVIASDIIEHLYHPEKCIQEVHRILKPNGNLLISTDNIHYIGSSIVRIGCVKRFLLSLTEKGNKMYEIKEKYRKAEKNLDYLHINLFYFKKLRKLLEVNNFEIIKSYTFPYLYMRWRELLLGLLDYMLPSSLLKPYKYEHMVFLSRKK